jgi:hypothetical protein
VAKSSLPTKTGRAHHIAERSKFCCRIKANGSKRIDEPQRSGTWPENDAHVKAFDTVLHRLSSRARVPLSPSQYDVEVNPVPLSPTMRGQPRLSTTWVKFTPDAQGAERRVDQGQGFSDEIVVEGQYTKTPVAGQRECLH